MSALKGCAPLAVAHCPFPDGATADTHDYFRGFSGIFDQTIKMAEVVTDVGYRLQINSTITKNNVREAPQLLKRVIEMGAKLWACSSSFPPAVALV